jgi:hypothetical protein
VRATTGHAGSLGPVHAATLDADANQWRFQRLAERFRTFGVVSARFR